MFCAEPERLGIGLAFIISIIMDNVSHNTPDDGSPRADAERTFSCRLFSDKVTIDLCDRRRRELDARGGFSCDDCASWQYGPGAGSP